MRIMNYRRLDIIEKTKQHKNEELLDENVKRRERSTRHEMTKIKGIKKMAEVSTYRECGDRVGVRVATWWWEGGESSGNERMRRIVSGI